MSEKLSWVLRVRTTSSVCLLFTLVNLVASDIAGSLGTRVNFVLSFCMIKFHKKLRFLIDLVFLDYRFEEAIFVKFTSMIQHRSKLCGNHPKHERTKET